MSWGNFGLSESTLDAWHLAVFFRLIPGRLALHIASKGKCRVARSER